MHTYLSFFLGIIFSSMHYLPQAIESASVRLLSVILEGGETAPCILEWDSFSALVTLSLSLPSIFPKILGMAVGSMQVRRPLYGLILIA